MCLNQEFYSMRVVPPRTGSPSTRFIKGSTFKDIFGDKIGVQRPATIRWLFVWGEGTTFKEIFWGTNPENRDIQCLPIHFFINGGLRAPMTRECIPLRC